MDWHDYISIDPNIIFGKPAVKGTRMGVEFLLELFAAGWDEEMVLENYSHLSPESLRAVFSYGADAISERVAADELVVNA